MIVDSSAIVAIARDEPERLPFVQLMLDAEICRLSAGTFVELCAVAIRQRTFSFDWLDRAIVTYRLVIEPVTVQQARIGQTAYARYGIGSQDPAKLNFGDCFAYALAKETGEPLLFKGDDFARTDVIAAFRPA